MATPAARLLGAGVDWGPEIFWVRQRKVVETFTLMEVPASFQAQRRPLEGSFVTIVKNCKEKTLFCFNISSRPLSDECDNEPGKC